MGRSDANADVPTPDTAPPETAVAEPMRLLWRRMALLAIVGVVGAGAALSYLALRPAHAHSNKVSPNVALAVSCPTARFCVAVDDQGRAVTFSDGVWSAPRSLVDTGLNAVSCPTPRFCVAVAVNGDVLTMRGSRWSSPLSIDAKSAGETDSFGTSGLSTVSCASPTFCMAGDVLGRVSSFDGTRWRRPRRLEPTDLYLSDRHDGTVGISGLSCAAPTSCMAVTVAGNATGFDGKDWSSPVALVPAKVVGLDRYLDHSALGAVSCATPAFCAAVDPGGDVLTFDSGSWSAPVAVDPQSATTGDGDGLTAISCPTASFCAAVDGRGAARTDHDGTWSGPASIEPSLGLTSVSCPTASFCVALDDLGRAATYDGQVWSAPQDIDR